MNTKDIEEVVEQILVDITNCDGEQEVREMLQEHLTTLTQHHEAEVEKRVEAERERITAWVKQRISHELGDVIAASEGAYRPTEIEIAQEKAHNRAIKCVLDFLTPTKTDKQGE